MNKITIVGRLVRDPEMVAINDGTEKCRFCVADDRRRKKDQPAKANFFNCEAWKEKGAFVNTWFKKGSGIVIVGHVNIDTVEKDGNKTTYLTVVADEVYFPPTTKSEKSEQVPVIDEQSGMEQVDTEQCPF